MAMLHRRLLTSALWSRLQGLSWEPSVSIAAFRSASSSSAENQKPDSSDAEPKSYTTLPGKKGLPLIGTMLEMIMLETNSIHKFFDKRAKEFGPVYREYSPGFDAVLIQDPQHVREMFDAQGKYPKRVEVKPWVEYRKERNLPMATLVGEGEEWQRNRSAVNRHMMRPMNVAAHTDDFNAVVSDFMPIFDELVEKHDGVIPDLQRKLFCWSLESGCTIIFDDRLGCLQFPPSERIAKFMVGVDAMLSTTDKLLVIPPALAKKLRLPLWKTHCEGWDAMIEIGKHYTLKKVKEVREKLARNEEVSGLIATLVQHSDLTEDEIHMNCIELMAGALESTAITASWLMYLLASNPDKQQIMYEEVKQVLPSGGIVGQTELRDMRYMKAALKETLRLYPTAPFNSRILPEDAVIAGYHVKKGTMVTMQLWTMSRDPKLYSDPESFQPERWLRENMEKEPIHPFANVPFGHGARACIGRRVAELEIFLLMSRILQKYELIEARPGQEVDTMSTVVLRPKGDIGLLFKKRS